MGRIASELSDHVVLTSDNPRFESPLRIIGEIRSGMTKAPILEEVDRSKAIQFAVKTATANDYILLAGKGHENYQVIGGRMEPFSDRVEVTRLFGCNDQGLNMLPRELEDLARYLKVPPMVQYQSLDSLSTVARLLRVISLWPYR